MKFVLIKSIHLLIRKMPLNLVLLFAYPFGIINYFFTPLQNFRISKRKNFIEGYSILKVKINYVKYWIETIWLTKAGYKKYVDPLVEIINGEEISKLNKSFNSYIIALPHVGNWEFAIPQGEGLGLNLLAVAEPLED